MHAYIHMADVAAICTCGNQAGGSPPSILMGGSNGTAGFSWGAAPKMMLVRLPAQMQWWVPRVDFERTWWIKSDGTNVSLMISTFRRWSDRPFRWVHEVDVLLVIFHTQMYNYTPTHTLKYKKINESTALGLRLDKRGLRRPCQEERIHHQVKQPDKEEM